MLGAILGDIAGSRFEFNPTNNYDFQIFGKGAAFTDDSICTVAIAESIMTGTPYGKSLKKWCRRYPHPMGDYGARFEAWVNSDDESPYGSFGNGSAMRVSPVAWAFDSEAEVLSEAGRSAACTHSHPEGIKGAQTVALAIFLTRRYSSAISDENMVKDIVISRCLKFSGYNIELDMDSVRNKFDATCMGTVPVALRIFRDSYSAEDAIRRAVSLGADADTLGAITGSIAEAMWGIPKQMAIEAGSLLTPEMRNVVTAFYKRYLHTDPINPAAL